MNQNVILNIVINEIEQQDKINELKKKCVKFKAVIVKLKEKLPADPKKKEKKTLHKKEKTASSDSDLDSEG